MERQRTSGLRLAEWHRRGPLASTDTIPEMPSVAVVEQATANTDKLPPAPPRAQSTQALVTAGVRRFYEVYGMLPKEISVNLLRSIRLQFLQCGLLSVDCGDIGCYTVEVVPKPLLKMNAVWCSCLEKGLGVQAIFYL